MRTTRWLGLANHMLPPAMQWAYRYNGGFLNTLA